MQVEKENSYSGQSCCINTGQAAHLPDPEGAVGEFSNDAFSPGPLAPCIALHDWPTFGKPLLICSTCVPQDFTVSRDLVLDFEILFTA